MKLQIALLIFSFFLYGNKTQYIKIEKTELTGKHWAGYCNNMTCDTMNYKAFNKYNSDLYKWGSGYIEGIQFYKDSIAQTYRNVLCSTESDPIDNFPSKWWWLGSDTLIVDGYYFLTRYKVTELNRKVLKMQVIDTKMKVLKN